MDDVPSFVAAATEDRSSYGYTRVPEDDVGMAAYVRHLLDERDRRQMVPFAVTIRNSRIVGMTGFLDLDYWSTPLSSGGSGEVPRGVEIGGTWYAASAQRTAVNTECKLLMLTFAFEQWLVERVSFKTDARNVTSQVAIERLGAHREGTRRAHLLAADGTIRDSMYFSILRSEWPVVRQNLQKMLR
jgi:RimJ/RimL family protein N-acetyltransferase